MKCDPAPRPPPSAATPESFRACINYMIRRARQRPRGSGGEDLWSDSLYAIHMTTGRWMPKCTRNVEFIRNLRRDWRALQRHRPGECRLRHVRSHTKVPGNEIADWLAERGAANHHECASSAAKWATNYLQEQYEALRRRHPPPPPPPACARGGAGPPTPCGSPEVLARACSPGTWPLGHGGRPADASRALSGERRSNKQASK